MKNFKLELKWGLIFTVIALLWMVLEKMMGWHDVHIADHPKYTMLFVPIAFLVYFLALSDKQKQDGGLTIKSAFISGLVIGLVVMILTPLSQYIVHNLVSPDYFANAAAYAISSGTMTQEAADTYFNFKNYLLQAALSAPIMGAVTALIVGGVMVLLQKKM
jgi:hypothetical protein